MTRRRRNAQPAAPQPRSHQVAAIDRIPQGDIGEVPRGRIPDRRPARLKVLECVAVAVERHRRDGRDHLANPKGGVLWIATSNQVDMAVDQPGKHRVLRSIENLVAFGNRAVVLSAHRGEAIPFNQDQGIATRRLAGAINEAPGADG